MVMGANIGTSMTSTLVSLTHIGDPQQVCFVNNLDPKKFKPYIIVNATKTFYQSKVFSLHFKFERAFSAATVHDCFNWLGVIALLIIEVK